MRNTVHLALLHYLTCQQVDSISDTTREQLQVIQKSRKHPDPKVITDLKKRKLVTTQRVISFKVEKGPKFASELVKEETDLTADMIARYTSSFHPWQESFAKSRQWCMEDSQTETLQFRGHGSNNHEWSTSSLYTSRPLRTSPLSLCTLQ